MAIRAMNWRHFVETNELELKELTTTVPVNRVPQRYKFRKLVREGQYEVSSQFATDYGGEHEEREPVIWKSAPCLIGSYVEEHRYEEPKFRRFGYDYHRKSSFRIEERGASPIPRDFFTEDRSHPEPNSGTVWNTYVQRSLDNREGAWRSIRPIGNGIETLGLIPWSTPGAVCDPWPGTLLEPRHLHLPDAGDPDVSAYVARAIREVVPVIKPKLSLLVTLAELRDLSRIAESVLGTARRLVYGPVGSSVTLRKNLAKRIRSKSARDRWLKRTRSLFAKGTLNQIVREVPSIASEIWLTHSFGTRQVVSDCSGIATALTSTTDELQRLLSGVGKVHVSHWSPSGSPFEEELQWVGPQDSDSTRYWESNRVWVTKRRVRDTVTMKYTYSLADALGGHLDPAERGTLARLAYLDAMGIGVNPAVVWDLIPFSFVVDYFVKVQDWLDQFKVNMIRPSLGILDCCFSRKVETASRFRTRRFHCEWDFFDETLLAKKLVGYCVANLHDTEYERYRVAVPPEGLSGAVMDLELGDPGWDQFWIGASLLGK